MIIAGDYCPQYRVAKQIDSGDNSSLLSVKDLVSRFDYSIVNLECPITTGKEEPIRKCGPNLQCSIKGLEAIQQAGFRCVTLANNHINDFGSQGVKNTLKECDSHLIDHVGGGSSIRQAERVLYKQIDGQTLAVINCCEHEFSIASESEAGANPLNPVSQYAQIIDARMHSDFVIVIVHGGNEHYPLPSPRMKQLYRFFIDAGADVVVNHHQHCFSGYEIYNNRPIFYGLGNFLFDNENKRNSNWNKGFMVAIHFVNKRISFDLFPYRQCNDNPRIELMNISEREEFVKEVETLNSIILDDSLLQEKFMAFCKERNNDMLISVMPYKSRLFRALAYRGFIPSFFGPQKALLLYNYVNCEAHRDTLEFFLKSRYAK